MVTLFFILFLTLNCFIIKLSFQEIFSGIILIGLCESVTFYFGYL